MPELHAYVESDVENKEEFILEANVYKNGVGIMLISDVQGNVNFATFNTQDLDGLTPQECKNKLGDEQFLKQVHSEIQDHHKVPEKAFPIASRAKHDIIMNKLAKNIGNQDIDKPERGIASTVLESFGIVQGTQVDVMDRLGHSTSVKDIIRNAKESGEQAKHDSSQPRAQGDFKAVAPDVRQTLLEKVLPPSLAGVAMPKRAQGGMRLQSF